MGKSSQKSRFAIARRQAGTACPRFGPSHRRALAYAGETAELLAMHAEALGRLRETF
jgi:hypothetical protein